MQDNRWTNQDNAIYYEASSVDLMRKDAQNRGLDTHPDLEIIKRYIMRSKSILDVGSCYGRVLEYLLAKEFKGKIVSVEKCNTFFQSLNQRFAERVNLIQGDIKTIALGEKFDLILWMWAGISDFMPAEELFVLRRLFNHLKDNGHLILDAFPHNLKPATAGFSQDQFCHFKRGKNILRAYLPSDKELRNYAKQVGFSGVKQIAYQSTSKHPRFIYIYNKAYSPELIES